MDRCGLIFNIDQTCNVNYGQSFELSAQLNPQCEAGEVSMKYS